MVVGSRPLWIDRSLRLLVEGRAGACKFAPAAVSAAEAHETIAVTRNLCARMELGEPLRAAFVPSLQPCVLSRLCWCLFGFKPFQERADSRLCNCALNRGRTTASSGARGSEGQRPARPSRGRPVSKFSPPFRLARSLPARRWHSVAVTPQRRRCGCATGSGRRRVACLLTTRSRRRPGTHRSRPGPLARPAGPRTDIAKRAGATRRIVSESP